MKAHKHSPQGWLNLFMSVNGNAQWPHDFRPLTDVEYYTHQISNLGLVSLRTAKPIAKAVRDLYLKKRDKCKYVYLWQEDLASGMVGPFNSIGELENHVEFQRERGDAAVVHHEEHSHVLTESEAELCTDFEDCVTPQKDREETEATRIGGLEKACTCTNGPHPCEIHKHLYMTPPEEEARHLAIKVLAQQVAASFRLQAADMSKEYPDDHVSAYGVWESACDSGEPLDDIVEALSQEVDKILFEEYEKKTGHL